MVSELSDEELRGQIHSLNARLHELHVERTNRLEAERLARQREVQRALQDEFTALHDLTEDCRNYARGFTERYPNVPELGDLLDCYLEAIGTLDGLRRPLESPRTASVHPAAEEAAHVEF